MAIGLKSLVVLAQDVFLINIFGNMMKKGTDHFEGTVPVKSTSLTKRGNKSPKNRRKNG